MAGTEGSSWSLAVASCRAQAEGRSLSVHFFEGQMRRELWTNGGIGVAFTDGVVLLRAPGCPRSVGGGGRSLCEGHEWRAMRVPCSAHPCSWGSRGAIGDPPTAAPLEEGGYDMRQGRARPLAESEGSESLGWEGAPR